MEHGKFDLETFEIFSANLQHPHNNNQRKKKIVGKSIGLNVQFFSRLFSFRQSVIHCKHIEIRCIACHVSLTVTTEAFLTKSKLPDIRCSLSPLTLALFTTHQVSYSSFIISYVSSQWFTLISGAEGYQIALRTNEPRFSLHFNHGI